MIYLSIGGFIFKIKFIPQRNKNSKHYSVNRLDDQIRSYYGGFILPKKPNRIDFTFDFYLKPQTIAYKKSKGNRKYFLFLYEESPGKISTFQHISISHFKSLLTKTLINLLALHHGFILHASASKRYGATAFTGSPGAGKSTVMSLIHNVYPSLADDSIIIRENNGVYLLYQTPFIEKNAWVEKTFRSYPLNAVIFLIKSQIYEIKKMDKKELIMNKLIKQLWTENTEKELQIKSVMEFIQNFDKFYTLKFGKDKQHLINLVRKRI